MEIILISLMKWLVSKFRQQIQQLKGKKLQKITHFMTKISSI